MSLVQGDRDACKEFEDAIREISVNDDDGLMALLMLVVGAHLHAYRMDREGNDLECERYVEIANSALTKIANKEELTHTNAETY
jgi:hypothetical protein